MKKLDLLKKVYGHMEVRMFHAVLDFMEHTKLIKVEKVPDRSILDEITLSPGTEQVLKMIDILVQALKRG